MEFRELVVGALVGGLLGWLVLRSWYAVRLASAATERDVLRERVLDLEATVSAEAETAALVAPLALSLDRVAAQVHTLERDRGEQFARVAMELARVQSSTGELREQTASLVGSLASANVRGSWGEVTLRRVLEVSGLLARCDFDEQWTGVTLSGAAVRPDVVVHLPGERHLAVDAKVPMTDFLAAQADGITAAQADKMRAKATKATAAQNKARRAERLLAGIEGERAHDRVAKLRFPSPAPCGRTPLTAEGLSRSYGSLEVFTDVDLAIDRGSRVVVLGLNGAGKTTLLRILAGVDTPDTGEVLPGHGLKLGYYAQEHENLDVERTVLENMKTAAPDLGETEVRKVLGSFLFTGDDVDKPARVLSGGEKTRLSLAMLVVSAANVLLLDEPTNNLDPASREEILGALRTYQGAVVLVTHDEGAVDALEPERVLLLPDGVEDLWGADYKDLVSLA